MLKITKLFLAFAFSLLLVGCSSQQSEIDELNKKIVSLQSDNQALQNEIDQLKSIDYTEKYKFSGGTYTCSMVLGTDVYRIRFLSNMLIHVTGRDFEDDPIFDNYYIVEKTLNTFKLVEEVIVNGDRGPYRLENLAKTDTLIYIQMAEDEKSLVYSPFNEDHRCNFVSDNAPSK